MNPKNTLKYVSESFFKPNIENVKHSNQPYNLTPWDYRFLSVNYAQKGLLFRKPTSKSFSFDKLVESLKDSFALTLVHFYPLAGQLNTKIDQDARKCVYFIDYNKGPGAQFVHATLDVTISDILSPTYLPEVLYTLFDDHNDGPVVNFDGQFRPLLSIQVTELLDGVFIGFSMNHAIVDGSSGTHFSRLWSEIHNSKTVPPSPISRPPVIGENLIEHALFYKTHPNEFVNRYKSPPQMKTRIFHISNHAMKWLKNRANKEISNNEITITSFQALAALIWRALVRSMGLSPHEATTCSTSINARKRREPPLPHEYLGNLIDNVVATTTVDELLRNNVGWVSSLLHKSILNYDTKSAMGFMNRWLKAPSFLGYDEMAAMKWVRIGGSPTFDVYKHKFDGLGAPIAFRNGFGNRFPGKVDVFGSYEGASSVDVEISLLPESMATLESDQEFMDVVFVAIAQICISKL